MADLIYLLHGGYPGPQGVIHILYGIDSPSEFLPQKWWRSRTGVLRWHNCDPHSNCSMLFAGETVLHTPTALCRRNSVALRCLQLISHLPLIMVESPRSYEHQMYRAAGTLHRVPPHWTTKTAMEGYHAWDYTPDPYTPFISQEDR
ncbi:Hypothetical predicted protein [Pelobates cultripes]|uniref:Uncharacterized protein n=1 Tax=Pelobates cultripes TaxID=61616 RepID=A0AAD1QYS2_PELCU|nr:Hypothetical predicted protein [Pelobates cultripes]